MISHDPYMPTPGGGEFAWAANIDSAWHDCWPRWDQRFDRKPVSSHLSDFFREADMRRARADLEGFLPYATRTVDETQPADAEPPVEMTAIAFAVRTLAPQQGEKP